MTVTRYIGKCPVCEGDFRLHKLTMVHHGYRRPGHGNIVGDCFGVGYSPYELSTEGTEAYLAAVERGIADNDRALEGLRDPGLSSVTTSRWETFSRQYEYVTYTPADGYRFKDAVQQQVRTLESAQLQLRFEQRRCTRLIQDWTKRPVRTEEEDMAQKAQQTQARRAVIDEARAARQAKRDAITAKNDARARERQELIEHYRGVFERLADEGTKEARIAASLEWQAMHKRKGKKAYLDFDAPDLEADEALLALGLAAPNPRPYGKWQHIYSNEFG